MTALIAAIIPLIIALLPYLEKLIAALLANRQLNPRQQRRVGVLLHHVGRLRQACEQVESHGLACGAVAEDGELDAED